MATNHAAITGPKARPMRAVPCDWMANSATRIADRDRHHVGREPGRRDGQSLERREHRDRRRDGAVAIDQRRPDRPSATIAGRCWRLTPSSAISARMPPSPSLSTRIATVTYLRLVIAISVQMMQRQHPENLSRSGPPAQFEHRLEGVERAGADVAEYDPERREPQCREAARRLPAVRVHPGHRRGWGGVGARCRRAGCDRPAASHP